MICIASSTSTRAACISVYIPRYIYARCRGGITILDSKLVTLHKCTVEFRQPRLHTHDGIHNLPIEMENLLLL
ncbi:hypothetical protein ACN38_g8754 [Penicillium nordicum]|uniref:Uncharacterized protein n=1 Tax=Penicillium nordicum TaxID=229535 RepID=A0A0M8P4B9_9EURO|nr:hypothetical protein ACN38_g8754 [Penicillium nordicum]